MRGKRSATPTILYRLIKRSPGGAGYRGKVSEMFSISSLVVKGSVLFILPVSCAPLGALGQALRSLSCLQHDTKRVVHGLGIRKCLCDIRIKDHDVRSLF